MRWIGRIGGWVMIWRGGLLRIGDVLFTRARPCGIVRAVADKLLGGEAPP